MPHSLPAGLITQKNLVAGTGGWHFLLEFRPGTTDVFYFNDSGANISWDGKTWKPMPFKVEVLTESIEGSLGSVKIIVDTTIPEINDLIEENRGFTGEKIYLRLWHNSAIALTFALTIEEVSYPTGQAVFILGDEDLNQFQFPRGRFNRTCGHTFRDADTCKYVGADATCSLDIEGTNGCHSKDNVINFGGFPAL